MFALPFYKQNTAIEIVIV